MEHINFINDPKLQILNNDTMWSKNNNIGKKHGWMDNNRLYKYNINHTLTNNVTQQGFT
jgi:hypothetical protein